MFQSAAPLMAPIVAMSAKKASASFREIFRLVSTELPQLIVAGRPSWPAGAGGCGKAFMAGPIRNAQAAPPAVKTGEPSMA
ncbi:hypothetical protein MesoLjLb_17040 [Mesorhizobium sp. L-8-3]|nr:hypothetical protein MesoLjLb_17040 [Mesorhizobium sp. L-8-3]